MTRTGEGACEQGWDQIQTNLQEWSWAGEQALSSRQLNSRGFPLIFLKVFTITKLAIINIEAIANKPISKNLEASAFCRNISFSSLIQFETAARNLSSSIASE